MEIPLFPLRTVLCPGIALPLHVFEPRYRLLAERCVEASAPFGIVLIREGRKTGSGKVSIAGVGTLAEIREASRYPDGRYDLLVVGTERFTVEQVDSEREPYLIGRVVPLDDAVGDVGRATALAARAMRRFVAYLQLLQPMEGETADELDVRVEVEAEPEETAEPESDPPESAAVLTEPEPAEPAPAGGPADPGAGAIAEADVPGAPDDPEEAERAARLDEAARRLIIPDDPTTLSYLLSGIIQVDPSRRQRLLEAATTEERLDALDLLIGRELWMLRRRLRLYTPDDRQATVRRS